MTFYKKYVLNCPFNQLSTVVFFLSKSALSKFHGKCFSMTQNACTVVKSTGFSEKLTNCWRRTIVDINSEKSFSTTKLLENLYTSCI